MKKIIVSILMLTQVHVYAQQTLTVTDSMPVTINGLQAGYTILEESSKEVGKKGDFGRFKIRFFLTNTGSEAKIMYKKPGINGHFGPISNIIALFKCTNATGARLTNKMASMELQPCKIEATVEDKECGTDKVVEHTRLVDLGFWIKPGETVSKTYPMIVPLNERPQVTITFYSEPGNQIGTISNTEQNQPNYQQEFVRLKNVASDGYLQNENGPLACTGIDMEWWSAQWEILAANGSDNFLIKNRYKNNYLSTENSSLLSDNSNSSSAMWTIEESGTANRYYIKNAATNGKLIFQNGQLRTSNSYNSNDVSAQWIIEK
jgi:hypothetical protein